MTPLDSIASGIRAQTFSMMYHAGGGHFGGCLSVVEILTALYFDVMRIDPRDPALPDRDRLVLSKGHAGPALYATLSRRGYFPETWLADLDKNGGRLSKHADRKVPGVDFSTGALGMGLSVANGMAAAARLDGGKYRVFAILGDGELNEGQIWEAVMTASQFRLDNLVAIVDRNYCQIDGTTEEMKQLEPLADKWRDFGWKTFACDGHNIPELCATLKAACDFSGGPAVVIAETVKGKGIGFMEDTEEHRVAWHAGTVTPEQYEAEMARQGLEAGNGTL